MVLLPHSSGGTGIHFKPMLWERRYKRKGIKRWMIQTLKELDTSLLWSLREPQLCTLESCLQIFEGLSCGRGVRFHPSHGTLWTLCLNFSHPAERIQRGASWSVFKAKFTIEQRRHAGLAVKHWRCGSPEDRKEAADFCLAQKGLSSQLKHSPNGMGFFKNSPPVMLCNCWWARRALKWGLE